jgi:hypothetical protein
MDRRPDPPRASRAEVNFDGVLTTSDGHTVPVVVKDVSARGFRVQVKEELFPGELVRLAVGKSSPVQAEIRWALGGEAGGVFIE